MQQNKFIMSQLEFFGGILISSIVFFLILFLEEKRDPSDPKKPVNKSKDDGILW